MIKEFMIVADKREALCLLRTESLNGGTRAINSLGKEAARNFPQLGIKEDDVPVEVYGGDVHGSAKGATHGLMVKVEGVDAAEMTEKGYRKVGTFPCLMGH